MRVFMTGATAFIGGHVARLLAERGDDVVALVRSPDKAEALRDSNTELIAGDLSSEDAIRRGVEGADAVVHAGAVYKVGIPRKDRDSMVDSNVRGTERVLDAAIEAKVPRILYVSTVACFGNTHGEMVGRELPAARPRLPLVLRRDEVPGARGGGGPDRRGGADRHGPTGRRVRPERPLRDRQHDRAGREREAAGQDVPRLRLHVRPRRGHRAGILLALDKGEIGESYVSGEKGTSGELVDRVSEIAGRKPPRITMPTLLLKASAPLGPGSAR